jgi:tetratricopeptide (TPR) repeat protein
MPTNTPEKLLDRAYKLRHRDPKETVRVVDQLLSEHMEWIEADDRTRWTHIYRGVAYCLLGEYEKALADIEYAMKKETPFYWEAFSYRAKTHLGLGNLPKARADLFKVLANDLYKVNHDTYADERFTQAELEAASGDIDAALWALERAFQLSPRLKKLAKSAPSLAEVRKHPDFARIVAGKNVFWPARAVPEALRDSNISAPLRPGGPEKLGPNAVPGPIRLLLSLTWPERIEVKTKRNGKAFTEHWNVTLGKQKLLGDKQKAVLPDGPQQAWLIWGNREQVDGGGSLVFSLNDPSPADPAVFVVAADGCVRRGSLSAFLEKANRFAFPKKR